MHRGAPCTCKTSEPHPIRKPFKNSEPCKKKWACEKNEPHISLLSTNVSAENMLIKPFKNTPQLKIFFFLQTSWVDHFSHIYRFPNFWDIWMLWPEWGMLNGKCCIFFKSWLKEVKSFDIKGFEMGWLWSCKRMILNYDLKGKLFMEPRFNL